MSFFAKWATKPKTKKNATAKKKTAHEIIQDQVNDQLAILSGSEIKTADGKSTKKSWWNEATGVIDARIGVMPINNTNNDFIAQTKEDYKAFLEALNNWQDHSDLKKRIEEIHAVITKPKEKKAKAS